MGLVHHDRGFGLASGVWGAHESSETREWQARKVQSYSVRGCHDGPGRGHLSYRRKGLRLCAWGSFNSYFCHISVTCVSETDVPNQSVFQRPFPLHFSVYGGFGQQHGIRVGRHMFTVEFTFLGTGCLDRKERAQRAWLAEGVEANSFLHMPTYPVLWITWSWLHLERGPHLETWRPIPSGLCLA